jgi:hypothetical protein
MPKLQMKVLIMKHMPKLQKKMLIMKQMLKLHKMFEKTSSMKAENAAHDKT